MTQDELRAALNRLSNYPQAQGYAPRLFREHAPLPIEESVRLDLRRISEDRLPVYHGRPLEQIERR